MATSLVATLLGLALYLIPVPPKVQEVGRILFFVGLFWLVYTFGHTSVRISG